ncbi:MAG: helix-turn-helix domain-containing protein [Myxococcota bacterium]
MNYKSLGRTLRTARKRLGLSQFEVADIMGCSRAQVDNIEVARQRAPLHRLEDFAKAVDQKLTVRIHPKKTSKHQDTVGTENSSIMSSLASLDSEDLKLVQTLAELLPHLPSTIRGTLVGIVDLWAERYSRIARTQNMTG